MTAKAPEAPERIDAAQTALHYRVRLSVGNWLQYAVHRSTLERVHDELVWWVQPHNLIEAPIAQAIGEPDWTEEAIRGVDTLRTP